MAEAQTTPIVEDDENTPAAQDTRTVGQMAEAGEVEITGDFTTDEQTGLPRIELAPVKLKPKPEASVPTQIEMRKDMPPIKFRSLQPEVTEEVTRLEDPARTYEDVLKALDAGESVTIEGPQGPETYSGRNASKLARMPAFQKKIKIGLAVERNIKARKAEEEVPTEPTIAFVSPEGKVDVSHVDPDIRSTVETYAEGRKALDDTLRPLINTGRSDIDVAVRQYFVDDFSTGDMFENLIIRLAETGRAIPTLPGYAVIAADSALEATARSSDMGTTFSTEWAALADKREATTKNYLENLSVVLDAPTAAMGLNEALRDRIKNDPDLTDEQKDDFLYDTTVTGEKFLREFVTDETAYAVIEESFSQMNALEQWAVILAEGLGGGGILSKTKNARSLDEINRLIRTRKTLGLADDASLAEVRMALQRTRSKEKFDEKLLELGQYNKSIAAQSDAAGERIKTLSKELADAKLDPTGGTRQLELESEILNLKRMRRRNYMKQRVSPLFTEVVKDEAVLAAAAVIGRQRLEGVMGADGETAELLGFVGGFIAQGTGATKLGKKVVKATVVKPLGFGVGLASRYTPEGLVNPINGFYTKLTQADTTIEDYERIYFEPKHKRKMNRHERKMLKAAFTQVEKMDEQTQELFLDRLQRQMDLQDELLTMFPEGEARNRAAIFIDQSFAEASAIPQAIAAYEMAADAANVKGIKKGGLGTMMAALEEVDRRAARAQVLIEGFEKHVAEFGDPSQVAAARRLIEQTKASIRGIDTMLVAESEKLSNRIKDMLEIAAEDMTEPLEEDFFEAFMEVQDVLAKRLPEDVSKKVATRMSSLAEIRELSHEVNKHLLKRFESIRTIKDRKDLHNASLATSAEAVIFARQGALAEEMDIPYNEFRKFVAETDRPKIDISPAVSEMLRLAQGDDKDIRTFFGPEATFFSGYLGRKSMKMFNKMVRSTINELPEDELQEMFTALTEEGVDPEDLEMLLRNNPVQFGLFLHQEGKLNVFANATIEEAEEFRRAFRDYGHKTSNLAVSREYKEFEKIIDGLMEAGDGEGYKVLKKARDDYKQLNDPNRKGTPLNRILRSKVGNKQTGDSGPYSGMYANVSPYDVFADIGKTVSKMMSGRSPGAVNDLRQQISEMAQLFGTPDPQTGRMRIDLRTEEGQVAMDLMEEIIGAFVYSEWAGDFLKKQPGSGQRLGDPRNLAFKTSIQNELEGINEAFNIDVLDLNGDPDSVLVFNITEMIAREKDIGTLIEKGGRYYEQGKSHVRKLKSALRDAESANKILVQQEQKAMTALQDITKLEGGSEAFYKKYIGNQGYADVESLRKDFMKTMKKDPSLQDADLNRLFDHAVRDLAYQGLMEVGGYGPVAKAASDEIGGLLGEKIAINGFSNTLGVLAELENDNVIRNLEKIMPPEQIDNLKGIMTYLVNQQAAGQAAAFAAKGMSANEAISRAYNIARGMVSPSYVATEVTLRMLQKNNSDALLLAMSSPEAARIMDKMLKFPKLMTPKELRTFDVLVKEFFLTEVARKGNEAVLTGYFNTYTGDEEPTNEEEQ